MRRLALFGLLVAFSALILSASPARAQQQTRRPDRLLFATATLGFGDCEGVLCGSNEANTSPMLGVGVGMYVRPIPYLAAGLDLHFNWMTANDLRGFEHQVARYHVLNLALRGIIPLDNVEPWGGVGFGLAAWGHSYTTGPYGDVHEDRSLQGSNLATSMGVDVNVADGWWIGGMFRLAFPFWDEWCVERVDPDPDGRDLDHCADLELFVDEDAHFQEDVPGLLWYFGATARADF